MSYILSNGATGGVAALPSQGYSPDVTSKQIKMLLRQNTFMTRVCNRRYQGELKGKGSKLVIPGEPNVVSSPYVPGQPLITQVNPKATDVEFFPNRARYIQTALTKEQEYFSAIGNLAGLYKSSGIADIVTKQEQEWIDFALTAPDAANVGDATNAKAGKVSSSYLVGTSAKPVLCFDSYAEMHDMSLSTAAVKKTVAAKLLSRLESVLNEQPRNKEMGGQKWVYMPEWFAKMAQLSDLTLQTGEGMGAMSYFFRDVGEVKGIGGFQNCFRSNLLEPVIADDVEAWPIIFGTTDALCFADELTYDEQGVAESTPGMFNRRVTVYDWYNVYPECIGVAWVTAKDYTE
jgi:hypothetical protein